MNPNRALSLGEYLIEEFYWAGKMVVYINNKLSPLSFEDACKDVKENLE